MNFVIDHVLQTLVIRGSDENLLKILCTKILIENLSRQFLSRVSVVHDFIASQMVSIICEQGTDFLHIHSVIERSCIANFAFVRRKLFKDMIGFERILKTFPWRHSIKCPMVIRLGTAWGLMMMSGVIPSRVNGMSS